MKNKTSEIMYKRLYFLTVSIHYAFEPIAAEKLGPAGIVHGPGLCSSDLTGQSGEPVALLGKEN